MPRFIKELRRRNVLHAAAVYVAIAWAATEITTFVFQRFGFPEWTLTLLAALFVVGFPVAMLVAWMFEVRPGGIRRTPPGSPQGRLAIAGAALLLIAGTGALLYLIGPSPDLTRSRPAESPFTPPERSIAVLPFEIFAINAAELEWLGDGIAETLLHHLAEMDELHVIARTSAFSFKGRNVTIREIGRELNVAAVLEGSVQKSEGRLRISAQLIDARTGAHLWSRVYERPDRDLFEVQDQLAKSVAATLLDTLVADQPPIRHATASRQAYDLYLLGRYHWSKRNAESIRMAIEYFQQAIATDPEYALAYSGLADAYSVLPDYSPGAFGDIGGKALAAARAAVDLAPDLAEGYASVGLVQMQLGEHNAAEAAFRQALELNPNYAAAHHWQGRSLFLRGKIAAARQRHERALALDPLAPVVSHNLGLDLLSGGFYDKAIESFQRALELSPDMANAYWGGGVAQHRRGTLAEAARWYDRALATESISGMAVRDAALLYLDLGDDAHADRLLEKAAGMGLDTVFVDYGRRLFFLARGQREPLLRLAEAALEARPDDPHARAAAALAYHFAGDCKAALGTLEQLPPTATPFGALFDNWDVHYADSPAIALLDCCLRLGRQAEAQALLASIEAYRQKLASDGFGSGTHYFAAQLAAAQAQHEPAIAHLERAVAAGWRQYRRAQHDPVFDSLSHDRRFAAILGRVSELVSRERAQLGAGPPAR